MENIISNLSMLLFALVGLTIVIGIGFRAAQNILSKERTISATVADKQSYEKTVYGKSHAPYSKQEYVITFRCGKGKMYFNVSEISYANYKVGQKGKLTYKGKKIINFK